MKTFKQFVESAPNLPRPGQFDYIRVLPPADTMPWYHDSIRARKKAGPLDVSPESVEKNPEMAEHHIRTFASSDHSYVLGKGKTENPPKPIAEDDLEKHGLPRDRKAPTRNRILNMSDQIAAVLSICHKARPDIAAHHGLNLGDFKSK